MNIHRHWKILHVDLKKEIPNLSSSEDIGGYYLVFFLGALPLGHQWIPADRLPMSAAEIREHALKAITPAVGDQILKNGFKAYPARDTPSDPAELLPLDKPLHRLESILLKAAPKASPRSVSIVVCTRDRPESLERCLNSLRQLSPSPLEILVVDNAPRSQATINLITGMSLPGLRYIREDRAGLDIARNRGIRESSGEIIAFTDDDVIADPSWIANIRKGFTDSRVMAVSGLVLPAELETEAQVHFEKNWSFNQGYQRRIFDSAFFKRTQGRGVPADQIGAGANMAFRRRCFEILGGFDERLDVGAAGCSGDSEFWYKVLANGWTCLYEPSAIVFHHHRKARSALRRQIFFYMRGHAAALLIQYEKHGHAGNLRRLLLTLPFYYAKRLLSLLLKGITPYNCTLMPEIAGYLSGIVYYIINARTRSGEDYAITAEKSELQGSRASPTHSSGKEYQESAQPLVSIIISCYNHGHFLSAAIESALRQTYSQLEIIVVDDGSTDSTEGVASSYASVRYVRQENQGLSAARNKGMLISKGSYLEFLDSDDRLRPCAVEVGIRCFQSNPNCGLVAGAHVRVTPEGIYPVDPELHLLPDDSYDAILRGNHIGMHATVMYRRQILEELRGFDTSLPACEDYDVYLRIARTFPIIRHEKVVAEYFIHGENMSGNLPLMLQTALGVLRRQRSYTSQQEAYRKAYRLGVWAWREYYGALLWKHASLSLAQGKISSAAGSLLTIVRFAPQWLGWRIAGGMKRSSRQSLNALFSARIPELHNSGAITKSKTQSIPLNHAKNFSKTHE